MPGQAEGGGRGDQESPPHGEERPCLAGRGDAAGEAPFGSRRCIEQAQHDRVPAAAPKGLGRRIKFLEGEVDELRWLLRGSHDHKERIEARHQDEIDWLKKDIAWLREVLGQSADRHNRETAPLRERNERLRAATMRATGMIVSLREKIAGLRAQVRALEVEKKALVSRVETLEAQLAKLRASRTVLPKSLFGRKSEQQKKPRSGRKRGQQRGAPGHGRLITLPPPRWERGRQKPIVFGPDTEPPLFPAPTTLDDVRSLDLRTVVRGTREGKLWNEFIARYHYLGYKTLVGAQMRYAVHDRDGWPLAMLGFSTAAWKLAPRDSFIGWTPQKREKNLPLVVDNPRFLILPWITIPNLGSHILALIRRRLPEDWAERYNTTPVLIETFVQTPRYTGAVYKASGWTRVGTTQGRGRYDRYSKRDQPKKDIWLRPLRRDWKRTLNR